MKRDLSLGIDTSNYKTSVAVVNNDGELVFNYQDFLEVKPGERGLRQSDAFFQHEKKLPLVLSEVLSDKSISSRIGSVSCSTRPRPVEGSYMPVFTAGQGYAKVIATALEVPYYEFSHQEGHIEAIRFYSEMRNTNPLICFHFSGGTSEAVLVNDNEFRIVGGTKDIAYGQVLDRIGVSLGMSFPCGKEMDDICLKLVNESSIHTIVNENSVLTPIKVKEGFINLSGIETQAQMNIGKVSKEAIILEVFQKISKSIETMVNQLHDMYEINDFIFCGGVSSSKFVQNYLKENLPEYLNLAFGDSKYSSDNAIGIALLGGKNIWL